MKQQPNGGMTTLTELMDRAAATGYDKEFRIDDKGLVEVSTPERSYQPQEVRIPNFYRFEGSSNPDDMAILYLVETTDGLRGTLTDAYGTYADSRTSDFIKAVENFHKGGQA